MNQVVVIEDSSIDYFIINKTFDNWNAKVDLIWIQDAVKGLDYLKSFANPTATQDYHPDLVLLDLNMPVLDGFDLLDELEMAVASEIFPIPIYICSSSINSLDIITSFAKQFCSGFISKPLTKQKLDTLQQHLKERTEAMEYSFLEIANIKAPND